MQAAAPERLIAGGLATPLLLAQVMVSKYCDHTPLYRQSQVFAHHGVDLGRSTLARWVGGACWWLEALHERLCKSVFASDHLFADDTPIPVLDPGRGRTKTGPLWAYPLQISTVRTMRIVCDKSYFVANRPAKAPIRNDPVTLMSRVSHGMFVPNALGELMATR